MRNGPRRRCALAFQHFLDQIDAAARAIVLVAAERGIPPCKAEVLARIQDSVRFRDRGIGELLICQAGLHVRDGMVSDGMILKAGRETNLGAKRR